MTIDETTGLPALPPKYRWRVTDYSSLRIWSVKIQYMLWGWWPITVEYSTSTKTASPDVVRERAAQAYAYWEARRAIYRGNPYRGNYPPKRLEDQ